MATDPLRPRKNSLDYDPNAFSARDPLREAQTAVRTGENARQGAAVIRAVASDQAQVMQERESAAQAAEKQRKAQEAEAEKQQREAEKAAEAERARNVREAAAKGIETTTDIQTGKRDIATREDGTPKYKVGEVGGPTQKDGKWVQSYRNDAGQVQEREVDTTTDPKTGEKYFHRKDEFGAPVREVVGTDPDIQRKLQAKAQHDAEMPTLQLQDQVNTQRKADHALRYTPVNDELQSVKRSLVEHRKSLSHVATFEPTNLIDRAQPFTRTPDGQRAWNTDTGPIPVDDPEGKVNQWATENERLHAARKAAEEKANPLIEEGKAIDAEIKRNTIRKAQLQQQLLRAEHPDLPDSITAGTADSTTTPDVAAHNQQTGADILTGTPATVEQAKRDATADPAQPRHDIHEAASVADQAFPVTDLTKAAINAIPDTNPGKPAYTAILTKHDTGIGGKLAAEKSELDKWSEQISPHVAALSTADGSYRDTLGLLGIDPAKTTPQELQSRYLSNPDFWTPERRRQAENAMQRVVTASRIIGSRAGEMAQRAEKYNQQSKKAEQDLKAELAAAGDKTITDSLTPNSPADAASAITNTKGTGIADRIKAIPGSSVTRNASGNGYSINIGGMPAATMDPDAATGKPVVTVLDSSYTRDLVNPDATDGAPFYARQSPVRIDDKTYVQMYRDAAKFAPDAIRKIFTMDEEIAGQKRTIPVEESHTVTNPDAGFQKQVAMNKATREARNKLASMKMDWKSIANRVQKGELSLQQGNLLAEKLYGKSIGGAYPDPSQYGKREHFDKWVEESAAMKDMAKTLGVTPDKLTEAQKLEAKVTAKPTGSKSSDEWDAIRNEYATEMASLHQGDPFMSPAARTEMRGRLYRETANYGSTAKSFLKTSTDALGSTVGMPSGLAVNWGDLNPMLLPGTIAAKLTGQKTLGEQMFGKEELATRREIQLEQTGSATTNLKRNTGNYIHGKFLGETVDHGKKEAEQVLDALDRRQTEEISPEMEEQVKMGLAQAAKTAVASKRGFGQPGIESDYNIWTNTEARELLNHYIATGDQSSRAQMLEWLVKDPQQRERDKRMQAWVGTPEEGASVWEQVKNSFRASQVADLYQAGSEVIFDATAIVGVGASLKAAKVADKIGGTAARTAIRTRSMVNRIKEGVDAARKSTYLEIKPGMSVLKSDAIKIANTAQGLGRGLLKGSIVEGAEEITTTPTQYDPDFSDMANNFAGGFVGGIALSGLSAVVHMPMQAIGQVRYQNASLAERDARATAYADWYNKKIANDPSEHITPEIAKIASTFYTPAHMAWNTNLANAQAEVLRATMELSAADQQAAKSPVPGKESARLTRMADRLETVELPKARSAGNAKAVTNLESQIQAIRNRAATNGPDMQGGEETGAANAQASAIQRMIQASTKAGEIEQRIAAHAELSVQAAKELEALPAGQRAAWASVAKVASGLPINERENAALAAIAKDGKMPVVVARTEVAPGVYEESWEVTPEARADASELSEPLGRLLANSESIKVEEARAKAEAARASMAAQVSPAPSATGTAPAPAAVDPVQATVIAMKAGPEAFKQHVENTWSTLLPGAKPLGINIIVDPVGPANKVVKAAGGGGVLINSNPDGTLEIHLDSDFLGFAASKMKTPADKYARIKTVVFEEAKHAAGELAMREIYQEETGRKHSDNVQEFYNWRGKYIRDLAAELKAKNPEQVRISAEAYNSPNRVDPEKYSDERMFVEMLRQFIDPQDETTEEVMARSSSWSKKALKLIGKTIKALRQMLGKAPPADMQDIVTRAERKFAQITGNSPTTTTDGQNLQGPTTGEGQASAQVPVSPMPTGQQGTANTGADEGAPGGTPAAAPQAEGAVNQSPGTSAGPNTNQEKGATNDNGQESVSHEGQGQADADQKGRQMRSEMLTSTPEPAGEQSPAGQEDDPDRPLTEEELQRIESQGGVDFIDQQDEVSNDTTSTRSRSDSLIQLFREAMPINKVEIIRDDSVDGVYVTKAVGKKEGRKKGPSVEVSDILVGPNATPAQIAGAYSSVYLIRQMKQDVPIGDVMKYIRMVEQTMGRKMVDNYESPRELGTAWRRIAEAWYANNSSRSNYAPLDIETDAGAMGKALSAMERTGAMPDGFINLLDQTTGLDDAHTRAAFDTEDRQKLSSQIERELGDPIHVAAAKILRSMKARLPEPNEPGWSDEFKSLHESLKGKSHEEIRRDLFTSTKATPATKAQIDALTERLGELGFDTDGGSIAAVIESISDSIFRKPVHSKTLGMEAGMAPENPFAKAGPEKSGPLAYVDRMRLTDFGYDSAQDDADANGNKIREYADNPIATGPVEDDAVAELMSKNADLSGVRSYVGTVPIDRIESEQMFIHKPTVKQHIRNFDSMRDRNGEANPVEVVKQGKRVYLRDGNHRVNAAKALGHKTIDARVYVVPENPSAKGEQDTDAEYMAAVERGDMATAQRMVDEAAKAAGYNVGPVYHGTKGKKKGVFPFTEFDTSKRGKLVTEANDPVSGSFFTENKQYAHGVALYQTGMDRDGRAVVGTFYLKDPQIIDRGDEGWKNREFIATDPSQIKSADPVTYDSAGNPIPLSERFNPVSQDIRYAKKKPAGNSAAGSRSQGMSVDAVNSVLRSRNLHNTPRVRVLENAGLTPDGKEWSARVLPSGTMEYNAANLSSPEEVHQFIDHELSHLALRDKAVAGSFDKFWNALNEEQKARVLEWAKNPAYQEHERQDEIMAETLRELKASTEAWTRWQTFRNNLGAWFRRMFGKAPTSNDLAVMARNLIKQAEQGVRNDKTETLDRLAALPGAFRFNGGVLVPPSQRNAAFAITAHHGTPHKVERFSTEKIGTGEGAQAYGYGLYFAENQVVAEEYMKIEPAKRLDGAHVPLMEQEARAMLNRVGKQRAVQVAQFQLDVSRNRKKNGWEDIDMEISYNEGLLRELEKLTDADRQSPNLYTVEILADPDELLDWDKPLNDQSEKVRAAFREWLSNDTEALDAIQGKTGGQWYGQWENSARSKFKSETLLGMGIKGIRYLDGNSRRDGHGTYNYVIFNDADIRITHANGQPVEVAADGTRYAKKKNSGPELGMAVEESKSIPDPVWEDDGSVFSRIEKDAKLQTVPTRTNMAVARKWISAMPGFQGGKTEMGPPVTQAIMSSMTPEQRAHFERADDYFGGGGSWALYNILTSFPNIKELAVYERLGSRLEKIKLFHTKGNLVGKMLEDPAILAVLLEAAAKARAANTSSGSAIARRIVMPDGASTEQIALGQAIIDYLENSFGTKDDGTGVKTAEAKLKMAIGIVSEQAKASYEAAQAFRQRGGSITYKNADSYEAMPSQDDKTMAFVDPPYFLTKGYYFEESSPDLLSGNVSETMQENIVKADTYGKTRDLLKRLAEAGNGIIYTDSAWWKSSPKHASTPYFSVPKEARGLYHPEGGKILSDIAGLIHRFDIVSGEIGKNRKEVLGIHYGSQPTTDAQRNPGPQRLPDDSEGKKPADGRVHQRRGGANPSQPAVQPVAERVAGQNDPARSGSGDPVTPPPPPEGMFPDGYDPENPDHQAIAKAAYGNMNPTQQGILRELLKPGGTITGAAEATGKTVEMVGSVLSTFRSKIVSTMNAAENGGVNPATTPNPVQGGPDQYNKKGRPDLAMSTLKVMHDVDSTRNDENLPAKRTWQVVQQEADKILENYEKAYDDILAIARTDRPMTDTETVVAKTIIARESQTGALNDPKRAIKLLLLGHSYRSVGSEVARSMNIRRDPDFSPAQRAAFWITDGILTPDQATRDAIDKADSQEAKEALMLDWVERLKGLKKGLKDRGIDIDRMLAEHAKVEQAMARAAKADPLGAQAAKAALLPLNEAERAVVRSWQYSGMQAIESKSLFDPERAMDNATKNSGMARHEVTMTLKKYRLLMDQIAMKAMREATDATLAQDGPEPAYAKAGDRIGMLLEKMGHFDVDEYFTEEGYLRPEKARRTNTRRNGKKKTPPAPGPELKVNGQQSGPAIDPATGKPFPIGWTNGNELPGGTGTGGFSGDFGKQASGNELPGGTQDGPVEFDSMGNPRSLLPSHDGVELPGGEYDLNNPDVLRKVAHSMYVARATTFDAVLEFWKASVLSGPKTAVVNFASTAANGLYHTFAQRFAEGLVNSGMSMVGQGESKAASLSEFRAMARHFMPALIKGWRNSIKAWQTQDRVFESQSMARAYEVGFDNQKFGVYGHALDGKLGDIMRNISFRHMTASDELLKGFFGHLEAAANAHRIAAKEEGLKGEAYDKRFAELMEYGSVAWVRAIDTARTISFQTPFSGESGDPLGADFERMLERYRNKSAKGHDLLDMLLDPTVHSVIHLRGKIKGIHFIIPFIPTMANLFKQGLRMAPTGTAVAIIDMARALKVLNTKHEGGQRTNPEIQKELASKIYNRARFLRDLSTQTLSIALYLAITGDDPPDELPTITGTTPAEGYTSGARDLAKRVMPPMTIRIGNHMIDYSRMDPISTVLAMMADYHAMTRRGEIPNDEKTGRMLGYLASMTKDKTFFQGIGDLLNAMDEGKRTTSASTGVVKFASSVVTGFIPNLIRQPLREIDPYVRENTKLPGDMGALEKLAVRIRRSIDPTNAPVKLDLWGREIMKEGTGGPVIGQNADKVLRAVNPMSVTTVDQSRILPIDKFMLAYQNHREDGTDSLAFEAPERTLEYKINGKTVRVGISDEDYQNFVSKVGQSALRSLDGTNHDKWKFNAADEQQTANKAKQIRDTYTRIRDNYRSMLKGKYQKQALEKARK